MTAPRAVLGDLLHAACNDTDCFIPREAEHRLADRLVELLELAGYDLVEPDPVLPTDTDCGIS